MTATLANRRLSTFMGSCGRDGRGNRIGGEKRARLRRQRTRHRRAARGANKQTLQPGLAEIGRICGKLELPGRIRETASVVFRRALSEHLLYGRAYESVAGACVYVAVRTAGVLRTVSDVAAATRAGAGHVARDARHLQRELDLAVEPPAVTAYLPRLQSDLGLDEWFTRKAHSLLEEAVESNLHSGRDPRGLAASALYTVSLLEEATADLCQTDVSAAAGVCPETVRSRFRELQPLCREVFDVSESDIASPKSRIGQRNRGAGEAGVHSPGCS